MRWRPILAAYVAGVGVNAILPARARRRRARLPRAPRDPGQLVHDHRFVDRRADVRRHDTGASLVFVWALTQGVLPSLDVLSALPAFDYAWAVEDGVVRPPAVLALRRGRRRRYVAPAPRSGTASATRSRRPSPSSTRPTRYFRTVVPWQLCDWAFRFATIWFFLGAFGIPQSAGNALLVQASMSLADARPRHARRDRHRASAAGLRLPRRRRRTLDAARVQRRDEADDHRRQRRRWLPCDLPHARDAPLQAGRRTGPRRQDAEPRSSEASSTARQHRRTAGTARRATTTPPCRPKSPS